ncbi:hypothetical protein MYU51_005701 [Penicillium brevicompactum]
MNRLWNARDSKVAETRPGRLRVLILFVSVAKPFTTVVGSQLLVASITSTMLSPGAVPRSGLNLMFFGLTVSVFVSIHMIQPRETGERMGPRAREHGIG